MPKVEIKLDLDALDRITQEAQNAALEAMSALRGEIITAQVVPKDYGTLESSIGGVDQQTQDDKIVTSLCIGDTPYARRLYFHPEYNFQDANNPNAQGKWAEQWLPGGDKENFVSDTYAEKLKERLK